MEQENEAVQIGKVLDETSYKDEEKHINIDGVINIDFIKSDGCIHEIKKSRKIEKAGIMQLKYYLYYLESRGITGVTGVIDYPLIRENITVELTDDDRMEIKNIIDNINEIVSQELPPLLKKKAICNKCAYYDICYI